MCFIECKTICPTLTIYVQVSQADRNMEQFITVHRSIRTKFTKAAILREQHCTAGSNKAAARLISKLCWSISILYKTQYTIKFHRDWKFNFFGFKFA